MSAHRLRILPAVLLLGVGAALGSALPAGASTGPAPSPGSEGPAGPPALMPNGRVAEAPQVTSPQVSAGCPAVPYGVYSHAPGSGKTVALTFDDGPGPSTAGILSVLRSKGVTATFFNVGQNAAARASLVGQEALMGYLGGNHTWDHPNMITLSSSAQGTEMDRATIEQQSLIGYGPCVFRPPYGNYNSTTLTLAQQRHMKVWTWSVDTEDWKANGSSSSYWVNRIISLAESEGGVLTHPVVLMHNAPSGDPATVLALPAIVDYFRAHGYTFVNLQGNTGLGYHVLTADGGARSFGAPNYGSAAGTLAAAKAIALATDPDTGGYWILKSNGGVANYNAPWYGSLTGTKQTVTALAASRGGYLVLTADGAVHNFGAPSYGSAAGTLGGTRAIGLAADAQTGGYWILKSNGGVANYNAPWYGSLTGTAKKVTGIAASSRGGYLILTSDGDVRAFGTPSYGSAAGTLGTSTAVAIAAAPATGGYWILKSNGGVANYNAPWNGSMTGTTLAVRAIGGM